MKALKCFYGEKRGDFNSPRYYQVGDEVEESPEFTKKLKRLGLVGSEKDVPKQKKHRTYSTKNAAPKESEDKGQKKID